MPRAAIFHAGVPAWAVRRDGLLVGALWRNANQEQCDFEGADGTDTHEVAVSYAVRVPTGVTAPRTGKQLREALAFATPLLAVTTSGTTVTDGPRVSRCARSNGTTRNVPAAA